ncbi:hypothetical protein D3C71_2007210 [compost metagenome]
MQNRCEVHQILLCQVDMRRHTHLAETTFQVLLAIGMQRHGCFLIRQHHGHRLIFWDSGDQLAQIYKLVLAPGKTTQCESLLLTLLVT